MFKHLCTPALIYLVISAITIVMAITRVHSAAIMSKVFFALLWTWFLNFLCSNGYKNVSWFLVLLPFILIFFGMFFVVKEGMILNKVRNTPPNSKKKKGLNGMIGGCGGTKYGCCPNSTNSKSSATDQC